MAEPAAAPPPHPGGARSAPQTTSGIVSLVFGIVQFVGLPLIGAIVALIAGYSSRNEAARNPEVSDDLGRVGRILGWIGLALALGGLLLLLLFVGVFVTGVLLSAG